MRLTNFVNKLSNISRHPLTAIILGFILTGIVGVWISSYYTNKQIVRDRRVKDAETRKEAVQTLSRFVYERRIRAAMLASSLRRKAKIEEIKSRKNLYDDAYVKWGTNLQANLLLVRDILGDESYSDFENHIEHKLIPMFRTIDSCLTTAYDARLEGKDPFPLLDKCSMENKLQHTLDCGYAITDELFKLSDPTVTDKKEQEKKRKEANSLILNRCSGKLIPSAPTLEQDIHSNPVSR